MILFFNLLGLSMVALAAGLFLLLDGLLLPQGAIAIASGLLVLSDLGWRGWKFLHRRAEEDPDWEAMTFVSPRQGGSILFVPVWVIGVVAGIASLHSLVLRLS